MKTTDYLKISSLEELRDARRTLADAITATERRFSGRMEASLNLFSLGKIIVPLIKKLRSHLSGTPFAKS